MCDTYALSVRRATGDTDVCHLYFLKMIMVMNDYDDDDDGDDDVTMIFHSRRPTHTPARAHTHTCASSSSAVIAIHCDLGSDGLDAVVGVVEATLAVVARVGDDADLHEEEHGLRTMPQDGPRTREHDKGHVIISAIVHVRFGGG